MKQSVLAIAGVLGFAAYAAAECPNACSGHGTCCSRDMCTCHTGFTGNDCSEQLCPYGLPHARGPLGDINSDGSYDNSGFVTDWAPETLYEEYGSYDDGEHPGYTECSSKGLCDRETGMCECFPGYEGAACQRAACPNDGDGVCSGHGVCRSMRSLAINAETTAFTYNYWDQDATMGCDCDPGYSGPSCADRECPFGVDPLFTTDGTAVYTRFIISVGGPTPVTGDFRLKVFDVHGEWYLTGPILVQNWDTDTYHMPRTESICDDIVSELENLPNGPISSGVTCATYEDDTLHGAQYYITLTGTAGYLKAPEVYQNNLCTGCSVNIFLTEPGETVSLATTIATDGTNQITDATVTAGNTDVTHTNVGTALTTPVLIKIGDEYNIMTDDGTASPSTVAWKWRRAHSNEKILYGSETATNTPPSTVYVPAGSRNATFGHTRTAGDIVMFEGQRFTLVSGGKRARLDKEFGGISDPDGLFAGAVSSTYYVITGTATSYTYVSQCSNRGVCNVEDGLCECFTGYKGEACETQVSC